MDFVFRDPTSNQRAGWSGKTDSKGNIIREPTVNLQGRQDTPKSRKRLENTITHEYTHTVTDNEFNRWMTENIRKLSIAAYNYVLYKRLKNQKLLDRNVREPNIKGKEEELLSIYGKLAGGSFQNEYFANLSEQGDVKQEKFSNEYYEEFNRRRLKYIENRVKGEIKALELQWKDATEPILSEDKKRIIDVPHKEILKHGNLWESFSAFHNKGSKHYMDEYLRHYRKYVGRTKYGRGN